MDEQTFYNKLVKESLQSKETPSGDSWDILTSRLDEHQYRKSNRRILYRSLAACLLVFIVVNVCFRNDQQQLVLEGPLIDRDIKSEEVLVNQSPFEKYDRLKDYDRRVSSNIKAVQNVNMHHKYADMVEALTSPHAFHPEDFASEIEYLRHRSTSIDVNRLGGNWYLQFSEVHFNKNLKIDVGSAFNISVSSEAIGLPQQYIRIPGQQKYFIKKQQEEELYIIEVLDHSTLIIKKFNPNINQFDEALYQKRDIG